MLRLSIASLVLAGLAGCASQSTEPAAPAAPPVVPGAPGGAAESTGAVSPIQATASGDREGPRAGAGRIIYFDYDSYAIRPEFHATLQTHARYLRDHPRSSVVLEGHTDERGSREYNLALGQKRSEAVRRALSLLGITPDRMEAVSFGEEKPTQVEASESAWASNRRAELRYR